METMKVFIENSKWMYELIISDAASTLNMKGVVTDTSELPPVKPPTPNPDEVEIIDSAPSLKLIYGGTGWSHVSNSPGWNANTFSYNPILNALITIPFNGYKIEWYTEKRFNQGIVGVQVDSETEVMVDLYAPTGQDAKQVKVFEKVFSTNGPHTLKLRCTGTKNPAAIGTNIIHDFVKVYTKQ